jgi:hypothetical protein
MRWSMRTSLSLTLAAMIVALGVSASWAAEKGRRLKAGQYNPAHESVEMFAAAAAGQIKVRYIPKDDTQGRIIIENLGDKPLNVELPPAFAAVPVLAQFGGGGGQQGGGQQGGGQQGQGGGGGGGFGGGGQGGGGGGGGFFNVPAEKVANVKVPCVCLEHGKDNPRPAIPYEIKPIGEFTSDRNVWALCALLGQGQIDQRAAQVAAWHFANGMSWEELAAKRIERLDGSSQPYFSHDEIVRGVQIAAAAVELAKEIPATTSPGQQSTTASASTASAPAAGQ